MNVTRLKYGWILASLLMHVIAVLVCSAAINFARLSPVEPLHVEIDLASLPVSAGTVLAASDKRRTVRTTSLPATPTPPVMQKSATTTPVLPITSASVAQPQPLASPVTVPAPIREAIVSSQPPVTSRGVASTAGTQAAADGPLPIGSSGAPAFDYRAAPVYPVFARRLGREGTVVLKLVINAEGRLEKVEVLQAAGFGFTEAAVAAIRQSTYRAARKRDQAVQAQALVTVRFRLRS